MARLEVGQRAPEIDLPTHTGERVQLAEVRARADRGVVVYFYPKAATPGCTTEACDFRDNLNALRAAGYEVVGVSADPVEDLVAFAEAEHLTFPLASDLDHAVADAYGAWGPKTVQDRTFDGVHRCTFVVDPEGVLTRAEYDVDAVGHVARLRESLLAG